MSTRCQIDFISKGHTTHDNGKKTAYSDRVRVYRHSDGYPDDKCGVIADLKKFIKWVGARIFDEEYAAASFIFWAKLRSIHAANCGGWGDAREGRVTIESILFPKEDDDKNWVIGHDWLTGHGVCDSKKFHGDIEYFYEVIASHADESVKVNVYEVNKFDSNSKKQFTEVKTITIKKGR